MKKNEFDAILKRYLSGHASTDEQILVEEWFDKLPVESDVEATSEEVAKLRQIVWSKIERGAGISKPERSIRWSKVAASLLLIVSCSLLFKVSDTFQKKEVGLSRQSELAQVNTVRNDSRKNHSVCLPDGSEVTLTPGSAIQYAGKFGNERTVNLKGDAFFDVVRDPKHPFVVRTGSVTTRVLGTSFWVEENSGKNTVEVSVKTGKVMVFADDAKNKKQQSLILKPNQKGVYDQKAETLVKKLVDEPVVVDESVLMKLRFENTSVTEILKTLSRVYGIQIEYNAQDIGTCTLTTELAEENLFERIQIICDALGLQYSIGNEAIEVKGKCK